MPTAENGADVPPFEGRKTEADAEQETVKGAVKTAGASAPVSDDQMKAPNPADTPGGATGSPADEQPAQDQPDGDSPEAAVGPAHTAGAAKGENQAQQ
jgi:hypothetical protein